MKEEGCGQETALGRVEVSYNGEREEGCGQETACGRVEVRSDGVRVEQESVLV